MKKIITLLTCLALLLCTSCSKGSNEPTVEEPLYYRVQTGVFRKRENADRMLYELLEKGYPSFLLHEDGLYKVQTGAYQQINNAVNMEQRLRDDGYSTIIVTK